MAIPMNEAPPLHIHLEATRNHLESQGEAVLFRPCNRKTGHTHWVDRPDGSILAAIEIKRETALALGAPRDQWRPYLYESGFDAIYEWHQAIRDKYADRHPVVEGWLFRIRTSDHQQPESQAKL